MSEQQAAPSTAGSLFVRRVTAMQDFELFLVSSIATILIVRSILAATGWPQLGGGKIHFAHLLWGGLGMLIAFILFIAMEGRLWRGLATLSAGIGFGLFIDELGKFITSDNDYFFQPAVAIMYVLFLVLFFVFRWLGRTERMSPQTALVNSFDFAKEAVLRDMGAAERDEALYVLGRADQTVPLVQAMTASLRSIRPSEREQVNPLLRAKAWLGRRYDRVILRRWFMRVVMGWFVLMSIVQLSAPFIIDASPGALTFAETGSLITGVITGALVAIGIVRWRKSRLTAFRWFERGALVSILIGEFFSFYQDQVTAVFGLFWLLLTLGVIRSMIAAEMASEASRLQQTGGGEHGPREV